MPKQGVIERHNSLLASAPFPWYARDGPTKHRGLETERGPLKACVKGWHQMMMCLSGKGASAQ